MVAPTVETITTVGSGTWTAPVGVTSVKVECWGGGGGGQGGSGAGGGGGEYAAEPALAVTPGVTYSYTVGDRGTGGPSGSGGPGNNGANTTFTGDSVTVTAHGGKGSTSATTAGGTGSTNTVHHDGGGSHANTTGVSTGGAGGGGSGGYTSAGNAGASNDAHTGGTGGAAVDGGGAGGDGGFGPTGTNSTAGKSGGRPGGGGGAGGAGSTTNSAGGGGGAGQISLTYTPAAVHGDADVSAAATVTAGGHKHASGAATIAPSAAVSAAGHKHAAGAGGVTAPGGVTATGHQVAVHASNIAASAAVAATGHKLASGTATINVASTVTAASTGGGRARPGGIVAAIKPQEAAWRYHALRLYPERVWLHRELPLRDVSITPTLSGPQVVSATLDPDTAALKMPDGRPLLEDYNVLIVAEANGIIRGGGLLAGSEFTGPTWVLTIAGFTSHVTGMSLTSTLSYGGNNTTGQNAGGPVPGKGSDPLQIIRDMWAQAQAKPRSDLGVTFGGSASSAYRKAVWHNVPNAWTYTPDASTTIEIEPPATGESTGDSGDPVKDYPAATIFSSVTINGTGFTKKTKSGVTPSKLIKKTPYWDAYVYNYETTDIGQAFADYASSTPFDYVEHLEWSDADKSDVVLRIDVGYPRLGAKRPGLTFVEGDNISELIPASTGGEGTYVNAVIAYGSGEGKDQLKAEATIDDGRLRVETSVTDTSIADATQLKAYATKTLNTMIGEPRIEGFTLRDHPNAPIGSFDVGDDVLVQITNGWMAGQSVWVRITAFTYTPDTDVITVECKRSDSYSYQAVTT